MCVVLDGANVSTRKDGQRAIPRLAAAITYFQELKRTRQVELRCVAFVPNFWLNTKPTDASTKGNGSMETDDWELLQSLVNQELVALTPSHAHDDFYVIDYAVKNDGFIVTNDMFRDHVQNQRMFQGRKLTSSWVKARCIDFTFVGNEFLPNSQAIERAVAHAPNPRTATDTSASSSITTSTSEVKRGSPSAIAATVSGINNGINTTRTRTSPRLKSSLRRSISKDSVGDTSGVGDEDADADTDADADDANAMMVDPIRKKNVDLSELTPYRVPRHLLPLLTGDDGQTMNRFQEHTNTYIVAPSLKASPSIKNAHVATLSIYGPEPNRLQAVKILDAALPELQHQCEFQQHQQWLAQQQQHLEQLHQQQLYEQQMLLQQQQQQQQYHQDPQHQQIINEQMYLQQLQLQQQQQQMMDEYLAQQQQQQQLFHGHHHHHVPAVYDPHPHQHQHYHGDGSMDIEPE